MQLDDYRVLGRSGLRVSPLCLGAMTFGTDWGWGADESESKRIFDAYAERGGNFIDTANFYTSGTSERYVGRFVGDDRDRFVLATKYTLNTRRGDPNAGGNHRKNMMRSVEASLERLGTDYIDLYWVHAWDGSTPIDEVMRGLEDLVRAGKILHAGISDTPAWVIARANTIAELRGTSPFVAMQMVYSLASRDLERELIPLAEALDLAVLPWSPLAGGLLTGKYTRADLERQESAPPADADPFDSSTRVMRLTEDKLRIAERVVEIATGLGATPAQVALRWVLDQPGVTSPIIGARTLDQLEQNIGALDVELGTDDRKSLHDVSRIELGFPHDFLRGPFVRDLIEGGTRVEAPPRW